MGVREYGIWINGGDVAASAHFERHSPSSGQLVARFGRAGAGDLDNAVAAAQSAFQAGAWSDIPGSARAKVLSDLADLILENLNKLSRIEADEAGKTMADATGEITWSVELLRFAASLAWNIPGRAVNHEGRDNLGLVTYSALPVVGLILPWNFPTVTLFQKLPYALAAGCSVVVKPSELTAGTTMEYARLAKLAGVPDGVVNVVPGRGVEVGEGMCRHPGIDMISFTGSTPVGRKIASVAGEHLKKVGLELGGKGANIVFADADMDAALDGALAAFTINQGEECCAGGRLLLEETIAEEFVEKLSAKANAKKLGGPDHDDAELGPMIHEDHMNKVLAYVDGAKSEGAKVAAGGSRATEGDLADGYFVKPTIIIGVTPQMTIFREEVFGPVAGVTTFKDVDEAVSLANDTNYGLANGVWTSDIDKAIKVSQSIDSGFVYVNSYLETVPQLPFGGTKDSGLGRENGPEGLLEFMQPKSTFFKLGA